VKLNSILSVTASCLRWLSVSFLPITIAGVRERLALSTILKRLIC
jgi:hypothetical protein